MNPASTDNPNNPTSATPLVDKEWLEAKLIEQEHRFLQIIFNFAEHRHKPHDNPLRKASRKALIWRIFSPSTAAVAGGGFVAVASLIILAYQAKLMGQQNEFLRSQNESVQAQIDLSKEIDARQRRTELISIAFDREKSTVIRVSALKELLDTRQSQAEAKYSDCISNDGTNCSSFFTQIDLTGINISNGKFFTGNWRDLVLDQSNFRNSNFSGMEIYRAHFGSADLSKSTFNQGELEEIFFTESNLSEIEFTGVNIKQSDFSKVDLSNSKFIGASITNSTFKECNLKGAIIDMHEVNGSSVAPSFEQTKFIGCSNISKVFRVTAMNLGASFE